MPGLPPALESDLVEGLGAYLRSTIPQELPARLRPIRGFTPAALKRRRSLVLSLLDDPNERAVILDWLRTSKPALATDTLRRLELALEQPEGWIERAAVLGDREPASGKEDPAASGGPRADGQVRKLKEELKQQRSRSREEVARERERSHSLETELRALKAGMAALERDLDSLQSSSSQTIAALEAKLKKATKDAERASASAEAARSKLSSAQKELAAAQRQAAAAQRKVSSPVPRNRSRDASATQAPRGPRRRLKVPQGRLEDDPETLRTWLARPSTHLLVDGYNVALRNGTEGELAARRDLLVDGLDRLSRSTGASTTVIFDGSEVPAGTRRRSRRAVAVEYSRPDEIADDHLIALLSRLPAFPVVVVTDDRELRRRAEELGATPASSGQLLSLLGRA